MRRGVVKGAHQGFRVYCCLFLIDKARDKEKTYMCVGVMKD
jgi:hypothetical protein